MNLAAGRNWLDCTTKLIYFCQMLIQGYMINTSNILMLPYINYENYSILRNEIKTMISENINDISVPLLRHLIQNGKSEKRILNLFSDILGNKAGEVMKTLKDLPILTVRTTVKSLNNNTVIPSLQENNVISIKLPPQTRCMFELTIFREGSSKMNVYSKKFSKQKDEFWFLIFVEADSMSFRKFSFSKRMKKIEIPVEMPPQKGEYLSVALRRQLGELGYRKVYHFKII